MHLPGVRPGGQAGHHVELAKDLSDHLVGVRFGAQAIELRHHPVERLLDFADRPVRVKPPLLLQTLLTAEKLFAVKRGKGIETGLALCGLVGEKARETVP